MLVYLVRQFTFDQVNHIAKHRNPKLAVNLDLEICRNLGIGNSLLIDFNLEFSVLNFDRFCKTL